MIRILLLLSLSIVVLAAEPPKFPEPYDSEKAATTIMSAETAAAGFKVPPGFRVEVFASEPDVRNPIACCWDTRGRFWVAENYTYAETQKKFDLNLRDRVLIFELSKDGGKFAKRTVFIDTVQRLTSVEVGLGGVWLMCPPQLLYVPLNKAGDAPAGPPQVVLEGFDVPAENYHNFANGLKWGPDGWLYGRCGASAPGNVKRPDQGPQDVVPLRGGIWRYHPQRKVFEALCHGTTNPWGHDWDEYGECFFTNTVGGHLWHMIPGAHYSRSHTIDPNPLVYEPMEMIADHWHFDVSKGWNQKAVNDSRNTTPIVDKLGGGHAHIGCMIYNGAQWPKEYRGKLFTCNMHGRRINCERIERKGSGYVGKHEPDFAFAADPMFRGMELSQGPDGSVYVLDWHDTGECHEHNGVLRSTGRIYRIYYGDNKSNKLIDMTNWNGDELAKTHVGDNEWMIRLARREMVDRRFASDRGNGYEVPGREALWSIEHTRNDLHRIRVFYTLYGMIPEHMGGHCATEINRFGQHHLLAACMRLSIDDLLLDSVSGKRRNLKERETEGTVSGFKQHREDDKAGLVLLTLASSMSRLLYDERIVIAESLCTGSNLINDNNYALIIWYGLIPIAQDSPEMLVPLASISKIAPIRRWIARRFAEIIAEKPNCLNDLLVKTASKDESIRSDFILGMIDGLVGIRKATPPAAWKDYAKGITDPKLLEKVRAIDIIFGDGRAIDEVRKVAFDDKATLEQRKASLKSLIDANPPELRDICEKLVKVRFVNSVAVKGLAKFDDAGPGIVKAWGSFHPSERDAFLDVMSSRPAFAALLLEEMGKGRIDAKLLSAAQARTIRGFNKPELTAKLASVWGEFRDSPKDKQDAMSALRKDLTPEVLAKADKSAGRAIFAKTCASCHKLYGEGEAIGPDLTGAGRKDMEYLLGNIVDPSAVVTKDFQVTKFEMKDGRVLTGIKLSETPQAVTVQLEKEKVTLAKGDIEAVKPGTQSLMPDGLLQNLKPEEVRNLFAYLQSDSQVALPK